VNRQGATFQRYLQQPARNLLTEEARGQQDSIAAWLRAHGVPPDSGS
jgi:hypothetical protein